MHATCSTVRHHDTQSLLQVCHGASCYTADAESTLILILLLTLMQAKAQYEASGLQWPSVRAAMDAIVRFSALRVCAGPAFIEAHSLTVVRTVFP